MRVSAGLGSTLWVTIAACAPDAEVTSDDNAVATAALEAAAPCPHPSWCPAPSTNWARDLLTTHVSLDLEALRGRAEIYFMPSISSTGASLDVRGLLVRDVTGPLGALRHRVEDGRLDVGIPLGTVSMTIEYDFTLQDEFNGYLPEGHTFLWPYFCGNLFPCKPETSDGLMFSLDVTGVPDGHIAIYPDVIPWNAPSYMPALAHGPYIERELGTSAGGTQLSVWHLPGEEAAAQQGTARLLAAFSFLEQTYGPYVFGDKAGSVSAPWRGGGFGGMEHHPFWHVGSGSMRDAVTHIHEAAHGWFGNGVRMACWEDFVLSEGSASYLAARGMEAAAGVEVAARVWAFYQRQLDFIVSNPATDTIAWPDTCNQIDLLHHPLWSGVPYMKGAFFLRAVEERVGRAAFDQAMAVFYIWHVGKAAHMSDLIDTIEWLTRRDLDDLVQRWLKSVGPPTP